MSWCTLLCSSHPFTEWLSSGKPAALSLFLEAASSCTINIMPNREGEEKTGPAGKTTATDTSPSQVEAQTHILQAPVLHPFHCLFLPCWRSFDQGNSERLAFRPLGTGPYSLNNFSMVFLFSGPAGQACGCVSVFLVCPVRSSPSLPYQDQMIKITLMFQCLCL